MSKLLRLVVLCSVTIFILCASALIGGRLSTKLELLAGLQKCDGFICYIGITPGNTTWDEAKTLLNKMPDISFDSANRTAYRLPGLSGRMQILVSKDDLISEIDLSFQQDQLNAGEVVAFLGSPCSAIRLGQSKDIAFRYPGMAFFVSMKKTNNAWHLEPYSPIYQLTLLGSALPCGSAMDMLPGNQWHGFAQY